MATKARRPRAGIPALGSSRKRSSLSRQAITASAIALADREGLEAVTVRRLAQLHDVTPMALYRYFQDKDEILDGIAEGLVAEVDLPPLTNDRWQDQLRAVMEAVLRALHPHPALAALVPTRILDSPAGLAIAERTLELLRRGGMPREKAAEISGYLLYGLVGMVTLEPGRYPGANAEERDDAIRVRMASLIALPPRNYPNVVESAASLAACASPDAYYKLGIDILITGVVGVTKDLARKTR